MLGTLIALLLVRVSTWVRILITIGLVLVWSMPPVVAVQVWNWMTNVQNGVLNYILTGLHFGNFFQHNWFASPFSQLAMVTTLVVWGALPFVAITVYAALSQVPHELIEAAQIDGARAWQVFKDVTLPVIQPVLLILTSLSILWDFGVFTQPYLLIGQPQILPSNYLMCVYLWEEAYFKNDYGRGAAISILMLAIGRTRSVSSTCAGCSGSARWTGERAAAAQARLECGRHRRLRRDGVPGLLDDLDRVQVATTRSTA